jgi:muramoyltetrapeptide carboxypeptidase
MAPNVPRRLRAGDTVRVIAPARSRSMVLEHDHSDIIERRFADLGLRLSYGDHVDERDAFDSSAIQSRVHDLHAAFADPTVAAIITVIGGFNSNELLPYLDWDLIGANPKPFCGFSDITALHNAILARTGIVTYLGPHWSSFGMRDQFERTLRSFTEAMFDDRRMPQQPSDHWTDDLWFLDQDDRTLRPNDGWWNLQPGMAAGRIVGGNLCTLNLLQGTAFMPALADAVLFLEDDVTTDAPTFARNLTSLLQLPEASTVRGLVIGRFQLASGLTRDLLAEIVSRQPALAGRPVLGNADFGHTSPLLTVPVGGWAELAVGAECALSIASSAEGAAADVGPSASFAR